MGDAVGKTPISPEDILEEDLYSILIKAKGEAAPLSPGAVAAKLRAAEDYYERVLQIFLGVRRVASAPQTRTDPPLVRGTDYDIAGRAFDFEPDLCVDGRWGWITLDYAPVVGIDRFFFSYPGALGASAFQVPIEWLMVDEKFGSVQIIPSSRNAALVPFNAYIMSVLSGGAGLPRSIYIDYRAGFTRDDLLDHHADLLEGIRIRTCLLLFGILNNIRTGGLGSQSLGMDGLSRSQSFVAGKYGAYSGTIQQYLEREQEILHTWKNQEQGPIMMVV